MKFTEYEKAIADRLQNIICQTPYDIQFSLIRDIWLPPNLKATRRSIYSNSKQGSEEPADIELDAQSYSNQLDMVIVGPNLVLAVNAKLRVLGENLSEAIEYSGRPSVPMHQMQNQWTAIRDFLRSNKTLAIDLPDPEILCAIIHPTELNKAVCTSRIRLGSNFNSDYKLKTELCAVQDIGNTVRKILDSALERHSKSLQMRPEESSSWHKSLLEDLSTLQTKELELSNFHNAVRIINSTRNYRTIPEILALEQYGVGRFKAGHMFLNGPAGSGKTYLIAYLILRYISGIRLQIQHGNVVASYVEETPSADSETLWVARHNCPPNENSIVKGTIQIEKRIDQARILLNSIGIFMHAFQSEYVKEALSPVKEVLLHFASDPLKQVEFKAILDVVVPTDICVIDTAKSEVCLDKTRCQLGKLRFLLMDEAHDLSENENIVGLLRDWRVSTSIKKFAVFGIDKNQTFSKKKTESTNLDTAFPINNNQKRLRVPYRVSAQIHLLSIAMLNGLWNEKNKRFTKLNNREKVWCERWGLDHDMSKPCPYPEDGNAKIVIKSGVHIASFFRSAILKWDESVGESLASDNFPRDRSIWIRMIDGFLFEKYEFVGREKGKTYGLKPIDAHGLIKGAEYDVVVIEGFENLMLYTEELCKDKLYEIQQLMYIFISRCSGFLIVKSSNSVGFNFHSFLEKKIKLNEKYSEGTPVWELTFERPGEHDFDIMPPEKGEI
jgi:hypothetical protein